MPGSIALVGSGEYLPAMAGLEKSLIDDALALGKKPTYIQIPTAAGRESQDRLDYWRALGKAQADKLGVEQIFLPIYNREGALNPVLADLINDSALIYLSGGDPHHLAESLRDTPLYSSAASDVYKRQPTYRFQLRQDVRAKTDWITGEHSVKRRQIN